MHSFRTALIAIALPVFFAIAPAASAESLTTTRQGSLPALPPGSNAQALLALDGHLVAFDAAAVWVFDDAAQRWSASGWKLKGAVQAVTSRGSGADAVAFVLSGATGARVDSVERIGLRDGRLLAQAPPPPPPP